MVANPSVSLKARNAYLIVNSSELIAHMKRLWAQGLRQKANIRRNAGGTSAGRYWKKRPTGGLEDRFRLRMILPAAGFEVQAESVYWNHTALFQPWVMYGKSSGKSIINANQ